MPEITTINLGGMLGYGANCYLVKTDQGYLLIDTGFSPKRAILDQGLERAGCKPGNLKLIVLTHGHGDHIGNCAYLRTKYAAPIAIHRGDSEMVEHEGVETNLFNRILLSVMAFIAGLGKIERFKPDLYLEAGDGLSEYGFDAKVLHLPGHSNGSIGILTADDDPSTGFRQAQPGSSGQALFCGDVFVNVKKPVRHTIVTDAAAFEASIEKLKSLSINTVYPGHGKPFAWKQFTETLSHPCQDKISEAG